MVKICLGGDVINGLGLEFQAVACQLGNVDIADGEVFFMIVADLILVEELLQPAELLTLAPYKIGAV